jgi:hypothetical protein
VDYQSTEKRLLFSRFLRCVEETHFVVATKVIMMPAKATRMMTVAGIANGSINPFQLQSLYTTRSKLLVACVHL